MNVNLAAAGQLRQVGRQGLRQPACRADQPGPGQRHGRARRRPAAARGGPAGARGRQGADDQRDQRSGPLAGPRPAGPGGRQDRPSPRSPRRTSPRPTRATSTSTAAASPCASTTTSSWRRPTPIAVGQQGLETPAGLYHAQDKQVDPSWHVPNSAWAGSLAGQVIPPARRPAQGALDRDLRRRRHPRDRRALLTRLRRLARLRAHGDPRRDRPLQPRPGRRPDLHP